MSKYLLTPGPVELPHEVILAGAQQLVGHRTPEFSELLSSIEIKLGKLLKSDGPVVILPSSGTGALECLTVNFLKKGDKFLSVSCGEFGDRFRKIAEQTGAEALCLDVPMGSVAEPAAVSKFVSQHPECKVLFLTHNETSTGIVNPIKEIVSSLPNENRPFVLVDGVSSVGTMECFPQEWGVDGLATASQKGLLTPPGLGFVWLSKKAWNYIDTKECSSYYFDLKLHRKVLVSEFPANPFTPPISLYFALNVALDIILEQGLDNWFKSRIRYSKALAVGLESLGFELLVSNKKFRSPGLTAFYSTTLNTEAVRKNLKSMKIETAGGMGNLKDKLIRVAHYNDCAWPELSMILGSLYASAIKLGANPNTNYITKALNTWNEETYINHEK